LKGPGKARATRGPLTCNGREIMVPQVSRRVIQTGRKGRRRYIHKAGGGSPNHCSWQGRGKGLRGKKKGKAARKGEKRKAKCGG